MKGKDVKNEEVGKIMCTYYVHSVIIMMMLMTTTTTTMHRNLARL